MKKILLMMFVGIAFLCFSNKTFASTKFEIPDTIKVKLSNDTIEEMDLETTYLYSVVQHEMGLYYKASGMKDPERVPFEALKAQAVASRSYAVYQIFHAAKDAAFHVDSTSASQVFKSNVNIDSLVKKAVDETVGQVILYDDEVACGYFFSTSGGHTESSENVWYAAYPYVRGVKDKYELKVDGYSSWTVTYTPSEIEKIFPEIGDFEDIKVVKRSENDRVIELKITGSDASKILLKNGIRSSLGSIKLKSQWFDVEFDGKNVVFEGKGFGHGIGMSQNGAIGMALEGFSYDEIIDWYYTDVEILGFKKETSTKKNKNDEEDNTQEETQEIVEEPKPMLEKLTAFCTTNWLLNMI